MQAHECSHNHEHEKHEDHEHHHHKHTHEFGESHHAVVKALGLSDACCQTATRPQNGEEAWTRLKEGNQRFRDGDLAEYLKGIAQGISASTREGLTKGQAPYAAVLTCADSRVAPELIFDAGLGELFVVRVAGNIAANSAVGSLEYAVEHLHSTLVLVLGHTSCGAVTAAFQSDPHAAHTFVEGTPHHHVPFLLEKIFPAVGAAKKAAGEGVEDKAVISASIEENARHAARELVQNSQVLGEYSRAGKIKIVAAVYDLASGEVRTLN